MTEEITERQHQFILTEEEKEVVAIEIPDIQSSLKECEFSFKDKESMDIIRLEDVGCKIGQALEGIVDVVIPGNGNKEG
ncbi:hypothetical protein KY289_035631 [Solanum tuberosum]|nr:hypothetical protein KY289_035615 [Solanum tuberosum]KAH0635716.1 hypothetical protein KY289_035631 [Solanum tuberosum]